VPNEDTSIAQVYKDAGLKFDGSKALPATSFANTPATVRFSTGSLPVRPINHSLQATAERRFTKGLTLGAAYTWSKAMGTAANDGDFTNPICARCYDYRVLGFDRTHVLAINYVWELPKFGRWVGDHRFTNGVFNGWELSESASS